MLQLLSPEIQRFIREHEDDDPYQISLGAGIKEEWPAKQIAEQIQSRQKAKRKIRGWHQQPGILFPPPVALEQSSSEITARFKASLFHGKTGIDLTGGFGIDSFYFARAFKQWYYVEKNEHLVNLARHNYKTMKQVNVEFHHQGADEFLNDYTGRADLIYLDPSRRVQGKVIRLQDSEPDVLALLPRLLEKGKNVLVKSSPLQDIQDVLKKIPQITKIYVVAVQNDCKEVLYSLTEAPGDINITCINFINDQEKQEFSFKPDEANININYSSPLTYLYEPNVAILKAGAFKSIAAAFNLFKLHPNSHLYTAEELKNGFPGRIFQIEKVLSFNKKDKKQIPKQVNIINRNFPAQVAQIAGKMELQEGGEKYLVATTLKNNDKRLLLCSRLS